MVLGGALGPGFGAGAPRHFGWQAWHNLTSTFVSRGRRGTISHLPSFCVSGVALMVLGGALGPGFGAGAPRHFAWQAWHNLTSTFVSRGRRGTISHLPSFCVAGVPLMATGWRPWAGIWRRGAAPLCVAGVAQPDIHRRFTWQAWHKVTSTVVLRGRRGTYGTGWRPWAGIWRLGRRAALCDGRRGTTSHPPFVSRGRRGTISGIYRRFAASVTTHTQTRHTQTCGTIIWHTQTWGTQT